MCAASFKRLLGCAACTRTTLPSFSNVGHGDHDSQGDWDQKHKDRNDGGPLACPVNPDDPSRDGADGGEQPDVRKPVRTPALIKPRPRTNEPTDKESAGV
jgi:hypothetical protein